MASKAVTIADDVKTVIDTASLSVAMVASVTKRPGGWASSNTVTRVYLPEYALEDTDYIRCSVIPATYDNVPLTRIHRQETYGIDIVLQKRPTSTSDEDSLMQLMEEINNVLEYETLSSSGAVWISVDRDVMFDVTQQDELNQFAAASRHRFRVFRTVT